MITKLFPILILLGALGIFIGYVHPTYTGKVAELSTEIKNYDAALESAKQFKLKEVQLSAERAALSAEQITRLEAFLPDSVDNVQLILDLNSLAARSGVQLSDFDIKDSDSESTQSQAGGPVLVAGDASMPPSSGALPLSGQKPVDSLEISVTADATYASFRTFLAGVENSLRPLDIVELSLKDAESGIYTYQITFRLYWLR